MTSHSTMLQNYLAQTNLNLSLIKRIGQNLIFSPVGYNLELPKTIWGGLPEDCQQLIHQYHQQHVEFIEAIEGKNIDKLLSLAQQGIPCLPEDFFKTKEQERINNQLAYLQLNYKSNMKLAFKELVEIPGYSPVLEELACHSRDGLFWSVYFAKTSNYEKAAAHLESLMSNPMNRDTGEVIKGVIFNDSDYLLKKLLSLPKTQPSENALSTPEWLGKRVDFQMWKLYYEHCFDDLVAGKVKAIKSPGNASLSRAVWEHSPQEDLSLKAKRKIFEPLFHAFGNSDGSWQDFLAQQYEKHFAVKGFEFAWLDLLVHKKALESLFSLPKNVQDQKKHKDLEQIVSQALSKFSPQECYEKFKQIGLEPSLYAELENYVKLNQGLSSPATPLKKSKKL